MKYTVVITERAAREIEDTAAWWARNRSAAQAQRWYDGIRAAIADLAKLPKRLRLAAEQATFPYEVRELNFGLSRRITHRVVFTIQDEQVLVLAVRHSARDQIDPQDLA